MTMDWVRLLTTERLVRGRERTERTCSSDFHGTTIELFFPARSRRLQDKTQVFPLAQSDYVRTRLTPQHRSFLCWPIIGHTCR